jgi:hypothetical protein
LKKSIGDKTVYQRGSFEPFFNRSNISLDNSFNLEFGLNGLKKTEGLRLKKAA